jgi:exonuclease III
MNNHNVDLVSWNVRGLNLGARCLAVHEMLADNICEIACLQETKLQSIDLALTGSTISPTNQQLGRKEAFFFIGMTHQ